MYHYDPVGHMEQLTFSATGASVAQIQPLLDNQVAALNMQGVDPPKMTKVRGVTKAFSLWTRYIHQIVCTISGIMTLYETQILSFPLITTRETKHW